MYEETKLVTIRPPEVSLGNYYPNHEDYFAHPEQFRMEPFRIFGNLYYVGDKKACPYLIDTGDGLIMIDTGLNCCTCTSNASSDCNTDKYKW